MIITGFLGSGKTSFLSKILKLDEMANSAVIINEFGECGLDHLLVDYLSDQTFALANGCLCCNVNDELVENILDLAVQNQQGLLNIDRIIIETSGISDTANLVQNIWNNPQVRRHFQLDRIITLISALEWSDSRSTYQEAERQLAISDTVIISKSDLLPVRSRDVEVAHLMAEIEMINARADCHIMPLCAAQSKVVIEPKTDYVTSIDTSESPAHITGTFKTCTLSHRLPVEMKTIELFLDFAISRHADTILRIKGLVLTEENPGRPLIIQAVKSTLTPFEWLKQWPSRPQTQITLIHIGTDSAVFIDLFNSLVNVPSIDRPDKMAISDNPLSITGLGNFNPD